MVRPTLEELIEEKKKQEEEELKKCTFMPQTNKIDPKKNKIYGRGVFLKQKQQSIDQPDGDSSLVHLEEVKEDDKVKFVPKGFNKTVQRLRKLQ